jgi:DNA-binding response OmpR family regulator
MMLARVLIVEDYQDAREMYALYLASVGYEVDLAADGHQALGRARAQRPDVIVLDIALPKLDGLGVIRVLRGEESTAKVPIITLSASAGPQVSAAAVEAGADLALEKPCLPDELEMAIRRFVPKESEEEGSRNSS